MRPSRLVAALRVHERPPGPQRVQIGLVQAHGRVVLDPHVHRDAAGAKGGEARGRAPAGNGSSIAATTRRMPAAITRTVHGPVRPVCAHGSSVQ
jgi:hypothetical protein